MSLNIYKDLKLIILSGSETDPLLLLSPFLDRQYTVFGKVIEGMEIVDKIKRGDENNNGAVSDPDKIISFKSL